MIELVDVCISEFGEKKMKIISSADVEVKLLHFVPKYLLKYAPKTIRAEQILDMNLRIVTTEIMHPLLEPVSFHIGSSLKKYFVVHRHFGSRISECVRVGVDGWTFGTKQAAELAFVRKLPSGVESGVEVCGCRLFEAEWMIPGCVAVGV